MTVNPDEVGGYRRRYQAGILQGDVERYSSCGRDTTFARDRDDGRCRDQAHRAQHRDTDFSFADLLPPPRTISRR